MDSQSHAYIYAGQRGLGKYKAALTLANELTNHNIADMIDVSNERYGIKTTGGSISVQTIRAARSDAYIRPYGNKKVFIINHADDLNAESQNALLKVLEEPPEYCIFILIADNDNKLLSTIRSRAITKRFAPLSEGELLNRMKQKYSISDVSLPVLLASGSQGRAEELMQEENLQEYYEKTKNILQGLTKSSSRNLYRAITFFEKEKEKSELLLDMAETIFRKILLFNEGNSGTIEFSLPQKHVIETLENLEALRLKLKQNGNYMMLITCWLTGSWEVFHDRNHWNKI